MMLLLDGLDLRDGALAEFERAIEEQSVNLFLLDVEPGLEMLRADPRFQFLRKQIA